MQQNVYRLLILQLMKLLTIAGGQRAMTVAVEGAEDSESLARKT